MIKLLYDFYLGALEAELTYAPRTEFSARMASFYCQFLMALEAGYGIEDLV